jgi:hypothetical protein
MKKKPKSKQKDDKIYGGVLPIQDLSTDTVELSKNFCIKYIDKFKLE